MEPTFSNETGPPMKDGPLVIAGTIKPVSTKSKKKIMDGWISSHPSMLGGT
jgi:hypothetical protein